MITLYGYKKCSTCTKAEKYLKASEQEYTYIDITTAPPTAEVLKEIVANSGLPLKKFFNTSGVVYREEKIKDKLPSLSEDEQITLLASNGKLLKRPILTDGTKATVGFKEETYNEVWK